MYRNCELQHVTDAEFNKVISEARRQLESPGQFGRLNFTLECSGKNERIISMDHITEMIAQAKTRDTTALAAIETELRCSAYSPLRAHADILREALADKRNIFTSGKLSDYIRASITDSPIAFLGADIEDALAALDKRNPRPTNPIFA